MKTVLLVEDDLAIRTPLSMYLENAGYRTVGIGNGLEALPFLRTNGADLAILDINLPGKDGLTLCREIRSEFPLPIIMLSARGSEEDKLTAFGSGADDYVPKPFSPRELVARVATVLKRAAPKPSAAESAALTDVSVGPLRLEGANYRAFVGDAEAKLTKTEFLLLHRLARDAGKVVERETLMKETFGYGNYLYDRTIDTHVKNLRKKI
ncbi:MAG: two-component system, OmpR family, response regulator BaeR [Patescibacteria group bacterium]|nr:two-component system, OmpR family, response regulator BaeR [Patescibacteria group bacterium]